MLLLGLGTNLGNRLENLRTAVLAIAALPGTSIIKAAPIYETDPVDCPPGSQPFFNTVLWIESEISSIALLPQLRSIEANLGRPNAHERNAPRIIDIDILVDGASTLNSEDLILPHPRLHLRRFVLQPMADIAPDFILPGDLKSIAEHLAELQSHEPPLTLVEHEWLPPN